MLTGLCGVGAFVTTTKVPQAPTPRFGLPGCGAALSFEGLKGIPPDRGETMLLLHPCLEKDVAGRRQWGA
jgi:hypothetical protein